MNIKHFFYQLKFVKVKDFLSIPLFLVAIPCSFIFKMFHKDLWLVCERDIDARDNGYWFFKYVCDNHQEQEIVYAINKKSVDYQKVKNLGKVISFGTLTHWIYYLTATKNISSQKEGKPNAALCYFLEIYGVLKNKRVFLHHGIVKDDLKWQYYDVTKMRLYTCAVKREYDFVKEKFGYPDGYVQLLGMCRFDNLHNAKMSKKQILVMPTWREWIGRKSQESYKFDDVNDFTNTEYYKAWSNFILNDKLKELLELNNLNIIFYPHSSMQKYLKYFETSSENIVIADPKKYDVQQLLMESCMLITDYSSVFFDFAYMNKSIIYYQFDYEKYRSGHYGEGYFSYENDGFGPVCYNMEDVLAKIQDAIYQGWIINEFYKQRSKEFFTYRDDKNCERTYDAVKSLDYNLIDKEVSRYDQMARE